MGRRNLVNYDFIAAPSVDKILDLQGSDDKLLTMLHNLSYERIMTVHAATGFELLYSKTNFTDDEYLDIKSVGIYRKWFSKGKGSIAPYGNYVSIGLRYYNVREENTFSNNVQTTHLPGINIAFGRQQFISESLLFDYGFQFAGALQINGSNSNISDLLDANLTLGISYLLK